MANIVLKNQKGESQIFENVNSIRLPTENGSTIEFFENQIAPGGECVEFTLLKELWNGTTYTLTITEFGEIGQIQLGIPPSSSMPNANTIIESAITIPHVINSFKDEDGDDIKETYTSTTIIFSAVYQPKTDVVVGIWGLK